MNKKILYYIWLSSTLHAGSKTPKVLLEHFGSIEKVFEADKESLKDSLRFRVGGGMINCSFAEHYLCRGGFLIRPKRNDN